MYAIILAILMQSELTANAKLNIFVDDTQSSKILYSELTRDWTKGGTLDRNLRLWLMDHRRIVVSGRTNVTVVNQKKLRKPMPCPSYRWGDYGEPVLFDDRSFLVSGRPLETVEALIAEYDLDLSKWRTRNSNAEMWARIEHCGKIRIWAGEQHGINLFDDEVVSELFPDMDIYSLEGLEKELGTYPGFPKYVPPIEEPRPRVLMPWER